MKKLFMILAVAVALVSCGSDDSPKQATGQKAEKKKVVVPAFDGNAAYAYVKQQCDFGPRVPGAKAHEDCAAWMVTTLRDFCDTVYEQDFMTRIYNGEGVEGKNIIGSFNPNAKKRIIVAAHWDSRPFADNDPDELNWHKPIDGANDGASGCGIMLEMAKVMKANRIDDHLGVDLIFFDLEDYGTPKWDETTQHDDMAWGLGSQYWSKKPHISGYKAYFGILLDMVGASNPRFPKEYYSQRDAAWVLNKVWRTAREMGYTQSFINEIGDPINDDHIYMTHYAGIPTIDIIHLNGDDDRTSCFYPYWHTVNDNIDQIDAKTLQMVGNVLMTVIYNE
ncbi:MAG: M28 family peptidase [Bacteroidales bacterium]|nr:M28 family peptidase [Bacteroidales bacterium]